MKLIDQLYFAYVLLLPRHQVLNNIFKGTTRRNAWVL